MLKLHVSRKSIANFKLEFQTEQSNLFGFFVPIYIGRKLFRKRIGGEGITGFIPISSCVWNSDSSIIKDMCLINQCVMGR